ncbi:hypothetical protein [Halosegnis marinus]|uniref:Uncharacterized protein n=1 Tax=Halosegnis marinus TaxID=3034023 RepID=A0ABD5ZTJ4_9EURY|nr:hypothetical protein [Halosegnis sp. DT85]
MVTTGALAVGVVVAAAAVTAALLVLEGPTVSRGSVVATLPWMVTAGLLHALGAYGAYPAWLLPVVRLPVGVLLVFVLGTVVWVVVRQFAAVRNVTYGSGRYLAATGTGAAFVVLVAVVVTAAPSAEGLLWFAAAPVIAAVLASVGALSLGVLDPSGLARTRWVGWLVAFGFALLGATVTVGIDVFGVPTTPATAPFVVLGAALPTGSVTAAWPLALMGLLLGLSMVTALARVIDEDPSSGLVLAVALAAGTVTPAVALLASTVLR